MPEPIDLVVHRAVLFDVGVRTRDVRLRLVVVVVAHEVLDPVVGKELPELVGQLRGEGLVGGDHERRALGLLDRPCDRGALARPGDAEQCLIAIPPLESLRQGGDRLGLIAGRIELRHHSESSCFCHLLRLPRGWTCGAIRWPGGDCPSGVQDRTDGGPESVHLPFQILQIAGVVDDVVGDGQTFPRLVWAAIRRSASSTEKPRSRTRRSTAASGARSTTMISVAS